MMRETGDTNGNQHSERIKLVSVRTGGAGHAHSGVVRSEIQSAKNALIDLGPLDGQTHTPKWSNGKIVRLGR